MVWIGFGEGRIQISIRILSKSSIYIYHTCTNHYTTLWVHNPSRLSQRLKSKATNKIKIQINHTSNIIQAPIFAAWVEIVKLMASWVSWSHGHGFKIYNPYIGHFFHFEKVWTKCSSNFTSVWHSFRKSVWDLRICD